MHVKSVFSRVFHLNNAEGDQGQNIRKYFTYNVYIWQSLSEHKIYGKLPLCCSRSQSLSLSPVRRSAGIQNTTQSRRPCHHRRQILLYYVGRYCVYVAQQRIKHRPKEKLTAVSPSDVSRTTHNGLWHVWRAFVSLPCCDAVTCNFFYIPFKFKFQYIKNNEGLNGKVSVNFILI